MNSWGSWLVLKYTSRFGGIKLVIILISIEYNELSGGIYFMVGVICLHSNKCGVFNSIFPSGWYIEGLIRSESSIIIFSVWFNFWQSSGYTHWLAKSIKVNIMVLVCFWIDSAHFIFFVGSMWRMSRNCLKWVKVFMRPVKYPKSPKIFPCHSEGG